MTFGVLNAAMLLGLAAMALPALAHLISRRRFDVVSWGAMQFLQLGRKTKRRIRLEELLLMAVRMAVLGLIALGMARPWVNGGFFSRFTGKVSRDVVLVIDGSYSTGWKGPITTPHAQAIQWAHKCIDSLRPGDTVSLLDVRDQVRAVIDTPSGDFDYARTLLDQLASPAGSSNLALGVRQGIQILNKATNVSREVIVLTDRQKLPWRPDDVYQWTRIDDSMKQASVPPRVWVVDVIEEVNDRVNVAVGRVELSRVMTVPDFPIRVRAAISQTNPNPRLVTVYFEVDGQRLPEKTQSVELTANGEGSVEFEHRFADTGSHLVSLVVDEDNLPGDDRSDAVVEVADGIPVLVVDGDPQSDPTRSESFFVTSAFSAARDTPWVRAESISWLDFSSQSVKGKSIVWLLNVRSLTVPQGEALDQFVEEGGTVVFAAGDRCQAGWYPELPEPLRQKLAPAKLVDVQSDADLKLGAMRLDGESLKAPWIEGFRAEQGVDLTSVRFAKWWKLEPVVETPVTGTPVGATSPAPIPPPGKPATSANPVLAKFENGLPWIVEKRVGKGAVLQLATPLDSDWSTLPSKNDFVPFLHEIVFAFSTQKSQHNVELGSPLVLDQAPLGELIVKGPDGRESRIPTTIEGDRRTARFAQTSLPGLYEMRSAAGVGKVERFAVNFDRRESDLSQLSPPEQQGLTEKGLAFAADVDVIARNATDQQARSEFWWWLMLIVLGMLVFEVVMTRRLVQGGHILVEPEAV
ncbi:MAG: VWA domain-containing protein [Planctomycetaceae bacterium]